jgi:hypothetical protein
MESNISRPGNRKRSSVAIFYHIPEETDISALDIGIVQVEVPGRRRIHPFYLQI